jgi:hypothetical protein
MINWELMILGGLFVFFTWSILVINVYGVTILSRAISFGELECVQTLYY